MNTSQLQQLLTHPILSRHIASGSIIPTLRQVGLCLSLDPEKGRTTYGLKHDVERETREYIPEGAAIAALLYRGYRLIESGGQIIVAK